VTEQMTRIATDPVITQMGKIYNDELIKVASGVAGFDVSSLVSQLGKQLTERDGKQFDLRGPGTDDPGRVVVEGDDAKPGELTENQIECFVAVAVLCAVLALRDQVLAALRNAVDVVGLLLQAVGHMDAHSETFHGAVVVIGLLLAFGIANRHGGGGRGRDEDG